MNEPVTYDKVELVHPGVVPVIEYDEIYRRYFYYINKGGTAMTVALYVL